MSIPDSNPLSRIKIPGKLTGSVDKGIACSGAVPFLGWRFPAVNRPLYWKMMLSITCSKGSKVCGSWIAKPISLPLFST
jgi:hypothetical protein